LALMASPRMRGQSATNHELSTFGLALVGSVCGTFQTWVAGPSKSVHEVKADIGIGDGHFRF
jgi:hypothetical protein